MATDTHSTPAPDPIAAIREALERHFAEQGITVDLDAVLPPLPPAHPADHGLARAYLDLEDTVAELHNMAIVTDMIIVGTLTTRSDGRSCILDEDHADALEYAAGKLATLSRALNAAYSAPWRKSA